MLEEGDAGVKKIHSCKAQEDTYGFIDSSADGDADIEVFLATDDLGERDDSWCLRISSTNSALVDGINFCPFCGEKLNEEYKNPEPSLPLLDGVRALI